MNTTSEALASRDVAQRLSEAEALIEALLSGQIDAVVDSKTQSPVLLSKAQDALRESEHQYRQIVETTSDGILKLDDAAHIVFVNRRFCEMLGYELHELVGMSLFDLLSPASKLLAAKALHGQLQGATGDVDATLCHKNGNDVSVRVAGTLLADGSGQRRGSLAVVRDVTEKKKLEDARREAELRFRRIFDSGIAGITVADLHGVVTEANDAFLGMVGYTRDDLSSGALNWAEMTPVEWRAPTSLVVAELRRRGSARPFEKEYVRKDGARVPVLLGIALLDEGRVLTVVTDLSERKRAGEQKALVEHTNETLKDQLRQSQKMEAVGQLASGIAHDFNNLLSVVVSYSELAMLDLPKGDPIREDIEQVRLAGMRAAALTRQLLMFSRQQVLEPKVLDLNEVLSGMDKMLKRLVGADIQLTSIPLPSLGRVRVDPGSIEQVIMNLVINARDAMPRGGQLTMETSNVTLDDQYVKSHLGASPGRYVVLSVTDAGVGMDKTTLARIFEPFFTTKGVGKGTGLGLSTVFGIVQQSAGSIWVYSEPGIGTSFKVYLPRVDARAETLRPQLAPSTLRGSESILLVEDEDQVRDVVCGILLRHGYTVIETRNAGEAFLISERTPGRIHLLLTDVVMPQMGGPELAKRLRPGRPEMKVLYMSGYTDNASVRHGLLEGDVAYLQKPITIETLTKKVRDVLDAKPRPSGTHALAIDKP
jgi:two-component system cell cycle sensor histidine kinase/response regulator CckA